jgi:hypothetical protein
MLALGRLVEICSSKGCCASWCRARRKRSATLGIRPFGELSNAEREEVAEGAKRMLAFAAVDAEACDVRFELPVG